MYDQTTGTVLTLVFLGVILIFSRPIWHWIKGRRQVESGGPPRCETSHGRDGLTR